MKRIIIILGVLFLAQVVSYGFDIDAGSLTVIIKYDDKLLEGVNIAACQVADAKQMESDVLYTIVPAFDGCVVDGTDWYTQAGADMAKQFVQYANDNYIKWISTITNSQGETTFYGLDAGIFLITASADDFIFDPFLVAIPMKNETGTRWNYNITAYPKTEPKPTLPPGAKPVPNEPALPPVQPVEPEPAEPKPVEPEPPKVEPAEPEPPETEPSLPDEIPAPEQIPEEESLEAEIFENSVTDEPSKHIPPVDINRIVQQEDGSYIEIDVDGIPLGQWHYDEDQDIWIFEEFTPLGNLDPNINSEDLPAGYLPQTGVMRWPVPVFSAGGLILLCAGIWIVLRKV